MSIFNKAAGIEQPKIAIWHLITDMTRVLDGNLLFTDFANLYNLNQEETIETGQYLTKIADLVQERATKLINAGIDSDLSTELARSVVFVKFWHGLIRCENNTITEQEFKANFGLQ